MLKNKYDRSRINNACKRALQVLIYACGTICDILQKDWINKLICLHLSPLPDHENIRGPQQYQ